MERVFALPRRLPVDIVLRPVLPMVMRGLPVPAAKRMYIVLDTRREADRAGVRFGRVCDPVGHPVERAFQLYPWARERGRAAELLFAFARAAFADGVDTGTDAGLRSVVERAGLSWEEALAEQQADRGWRDELEGHRQAMLALGLWGVPSFRLVGRPGEPDFWTWGQDRLWRVESEIHDRLARP
jgi:2-hydroxychromene-2-carboxylate isomerase